MPTEREIFDLVVNKIVEAHTGPCRCTETDTPGKCFCAQCNGATCRLCNGSLAYAPNRDDDYIASDILMAYFGVMLTTRRLEQWGRFNEQWEIAEEWIGGVLSKAASAEQNPGDNELKISSPGLSEEELRELGVLPEEGNH